MVKTFEEIHKKIQDDVTVDTTKKIQFRDTGLYIQSSADGKIKISSDGSGADDITLNGTVTADSELAVGGVLRAADNISIASDKDLVLATGLCQLVVTTTATNAVIVGTAGGSGDGYLQVSVGGSSKRIRLHDPYD